jgi:hypothetical protein
MESREALDNPVYRQEVWEHVKEVVAFVEQAVEARSAVHELERGLGERMLALGHGCLKLFFSLCGDDDEGEAWVLPEGRVLRRLPERPGRPYQSVFGPFDLTRGVYGRCESQKIEAMSWDERLRLPESQFSYLLQEWTWSTVVQWPYTQVRALWASLSCPQCTAWAGDVAPFGDVAPPPPAALPVTLVVGSADGKGVPIRGTEPAPAGERMHASGGPPPGCKQIAWVETVYMVAPFMRTPEEGCESLFDMPPADPSPARPPAAIQARAGESVADTPQRSQPALVKSLDGA